MDIIHNTSHILPDFHYDNSQPYALSPKPYALCCKPYALCPNLSELPDGLPGI